MVNAAPTAGTGTDTETTNDSDSQLTDEQREQITRTIERDTSTSSDSTDSTDTSTSSRDTTSREDRLRDVVEATPEPATPSSESSTSDSGGGRISDEQRAAITREVQLDSDTDGDGLTQRQNRQVNAAVAEDVASVRRAQQGVEADAGRIGQQAASLEDRVLDENPSLSASDVRIQRQGDTLRAELTPTGSQSLINQQRAELRAERRRQATMARAVRSAERDARQLTQPTFSVPDTRIPSRTASREGTGQRISITRIPGYTGARPDPDAEQFGDTVLFRVREAGGRSLEELAEDTTDGFRSRVATFAEENDNIILTTPQGTMQVGSNSPVAAAARGSVKGIGDLAVLPLDAALFAKETGEYAAQGTQEALAGRGDSYLSRTEDAAIEKGTRLYDYTVENPVEVPTRFAATAVTTGAAIGGAQKVAGARAGRAVSYAVQPGEELVRAGVRSGRISAGVGTKVPGVTRANIRGTGGSGGGALSDISAPDVRGSLSSARSRLPEVRLRYDADAGPVDIDPQLRRDLAESIAPDAPRGSTSGDAGPSLTVREATVRRLQGAQLSGEAAATNALRRARSASVPRPRAPDTNIRDTIQGTVQGGQLSAEAAITRARLRLQNAEAPRPSTPDTNIRGRVRGTVLGGQLSAEAAATNVGRRLRSLSAPDLSRPSAPNTNIRENIRGTVLGGQLSAEAAITNARRRLLSRQSPTTETTTDTNLGEVALRRFQGAQLSAEAAVANAGRRLRNFEVRDVDIGPNGRLRDLTIEVRSPNSPSGDVDTIVLDADDLAGGPITTDIDIPIRSEGDADLDVDLDAIDGGTQPANPLAGGTRRSSAPATEAQLETRLRRAELDAEGDVPLRRLPLEPELTIEDTFADTGPAELPTVYEDLGSELGAGVGSELSSDLGIDTDQRTRINLVSELGRRSIETPGETETPVEMVFEAEAQSPELVVEEEPEEVPRELPGSEWPGEAPTAIESGVDLPDEDDDSTIPDWALDDDIFDTGFASGEEIEDLL